MTVTTRDHYAADTLVPTIQAHIDKIEQLEIEHVGLQQDVADAENALDELVNSYYRTGLEGANERMRQAHLAELLQADADYQRREQECRSINEQERYLKISIESERRKLTLAMEMLRHVRPASD